MGNEGRKSHAFFATLQSGQVPPFGAFVPLAIAGMVLGVAFAMIQCASLAAIYRQLVDEPSTEAVAA